MYAEKLFVLDNNNYSFSKMNYFLLLVQDWF